MCFLSHSSPPQQRFYNPNGRAMWRKVCSFLLLAILLGKINYKACSSDPIWILKLSKKQFSPRGYQKELKRLLINQADITRKGQKTGAYYDMDFLQATLSVSPIPNCLCQQWPWISDLVETTKWRFSRFCTSHAWRNYWSHSPTLCWHGCGLYFSWGHLFPFPFLKTHMSKYHVFAVITTYTEK